MYIGLHVKYRYSCQILMQLEFLSTDFGKYSNIKIKKKNPSFGSQVVPSRRPERLTNRHDEANSHFSKHYKYD